MYEFVSLYVLYFIYIWFSHGLALSGTLKMMAPSLENKENIVGKRKNVGSRHFPLDQLCFKSLFFLGL